MTEYEVKYKAKFDNGRSFESVVVTCEEHFYATVENLKALYVDLDKIFYNTFIPQPNSRLRYCQQCKRLGKLYHDKKISDTEKENENSEIKN